MLWCSIAPQHMHTPPNTHTHRCCAMHLCARVAFVLLPTSCPISRAELQYYSVEEEWEEKQEGWRRTGRWVRRHPSLICPSDFSAPPTPSHRVLEPSKPRAGASRLGLLISLRLFHREENSNTCLRSVFHSTRVCPQTQTSIGCTDMKSRDRRPLRSRCLCINRLCFLQNSKRIRSLFGFFSTR